MKDIATNENNTNDTVQENTEQKDQKLKTNTQYTAVTCPKCGSTYIEFVTEYHKCIWLRVFAAIALALLVLFAAQYIISYVTEANSKGVSDELTRVIATGIIYILLQISIWVTESKTHIQGVCRNCGTIWYMN